MANRIVTLHNVSGLDRMYNGQSITDGDTLTIAPKDYDLFANDLALFDDIAASLVLIGNGVADFTNPIAGWEWLQGVDSLPFSDVDEGKQKLSVHPSYKPYIENGTTYAVWAGCGDNINADPNLSELGGGDLLHFSLTDQTATLVKDVKFDHTAFGRVWIHEAYLKFSGGAADDYVSSDIVASGAALQQVANLDLELDGDFVKFVTGGVPGTGTHGFNATPTLIPRTFSMDGDWDYDGANLTPNFDGTGEYKISTVDTAVHRYVQKIPCEGSSPYFSMSSDETAEILPGYFIRINVHNPSLSTWNLSVIMEIYRERTVDP